MKDRSNAEQKIIEKRMVAAECALLCTVLAIAIMSITPEFRDYAGVLSIPFSIYGLYFVLGLNK